MLYRAELYGHYSGSFGSAFRIPNVAWKPAAQASHTATIDNALRLRTESIHQAKVANPQASMITKAIDQRIIQKRPLLNMTAVYCWLVAGAGFEPTISGL